MSGGTIGRELVSVGGGGCGLFPVMNGKTISPDLVAEDGRGECGVFAGVGFVVLRATTLVGRGVLLTIGMVVLLRVLEMVLLAFLLQ